MVKIVEKIALNNTLCYHSNNRLMTFKPVQSGFKRCDGGCGIRSTPSVETLLSAECGNGAHASERGSMRDTNLHLQRMWTGVHATSRWSDWQCPLHAPTNQQLLWKGDREEGVLKILIDVGQILELATTFSHHVLTEHCPLYAYASTQPDSTRSHSEVGCLVSSLW